MPHFDDRRRRRPMWQTQCIFDKHCLSPINTDFWVINIVYRVKNIVFLDKQCLSPEKTLFIGDKLCLSKY